MRLAMACLLAVVSAPCSAAWELVGTTEDKGRVIHYIERDGMRRDGDIRRIRQLHDRAVASPSGLRSWISVDEYNCRTRETRMTRYEAYAEPGGTGTLLATAEIPLPWMVVGTEAFADKVLRIVCE